MQNRLIWLDNLKGFLIILVVLGHAVQCINPDFQHDILFRYIYSFHMPLFIFVSGYACYRKSIGWDMIKKRFLQLMIPYAAWSLIICLTQGHYRLWEMFIYPERSLWFLYALFFITIIHAVCVKVAECIKIKQVFVVAILAVGLFGSMFIIRSFGYPIIAKYFVYYVLGFYLRPYVSFENRNNLLCYGALMAFMFLAFFCMQDAVPSFMPPGSSIAYRYAYNTIVAISGIMAFMLLFANRTGRVVSLITKLGGATLAIYAIHRALGMHLIYKLMALIGLNVAVMNNAQYYIVVVITCIVLLLFSLILNYILDKRKFTRVVFLGKK